MSSPTPSLRRVQLVLTCCSIAANALCAGGIFTFPLLSPALAAHLKLTQPQLTTIILAGMAGQYPFSAFVGKVIDRYGPSTCSLIASVLFSTTFGLFSLEISRTPMDTTRPSSASFHRLVFYFSVAGLGTVFSYFSSLFAASKNFPNYPGIASGASMSLFGISPLFLSLIASNFFTGPEGLDVARYLKFMAIFAGSIHAIGALNLRTPADPAPSSINDPENDNVDEHTRLLPGKPTDGQVNPGVGLAGDRGNSSLDLLRDSNFWLLATLLVVTLGTCEMVISNIGTIVLSLPSASSTLLSRNPSTDVATSNQVRIISLANTISRLLAGPLADFLSPVASYLPTGILHFTRKHYVSRVAFLSGATLLISITFLWMELMVRSQEAIWVLSVGTGIVYGTVFTILPSIVSSIWGVSNLGRNFGIITYAPFIGTPLFSYLYAFVSAYHSQGQGICVGLPCWQLTFWVSSGASLLAFCGTIVLWKVWKGKV